MRPAPSETKVVQGRKILIYNERNIDDLLYDEIFDPDNINSGNIYPSLYSRVMKTDGSLWYVSRQDPTIYKSYLSPCRIPSENELNGSDSNNVQVISYGDDEFYLYLDDKTKPFGLRPDAKLIFFGNDLVEYILVHNIPGGGEEIVSMYFDATGNFTSNRIPLIKENISGNSGTRPSNCHTTIELTEGEPVTLQIFDSKGNLASSQTLYVRNTISLNDLGAGSVPIVGLEFTSPQALNKDECFIHEKQDISHLNIQPYLAYADGTTVNINIDNQKCFLLGADDYIPAYPGYSQTVILKYYLNRKESATNPDTIDESRFITKSIKISTRMNTEKYSVKLSIFPVFRESKNAWELHLFAYTADRDHVYNCTDIIQYVEGKEFHGEVDYYGKEQEIEFRYNLQDIFHATNEVLGTQSFRITVWNPKAYVKYTFKEDADIDTVYGADSSLMRRPIIYYDKTLDMYFIPTTVFRNWDAVIESFYRAANPPFNTETESVAPTPTHFNIRDIDNGQMLISAPISGETYDQAWPITFGAAKLSGRNTIVEFLTKDTNGEGNFEILYGVPVDVTDGVYNTDANRITLNGRIR